MASNWYRFGTVSVTQGSVGVTGVGTQWTSAVNSPMAGDIFTQDNQTLYEIMSITGDNTLTLDRNFTAATVAGGSYSIIRNSSATVNTRIASQVSETLDLLGSRVTVSTTAPSASQGKNGDIWIVVA